ncbi:ABC transporter permease subunit [Domibacillus mangrovi]|uniref:Multidrug ABC transporter permease n=1 Tax=Domibacillus mangrovi TaxID=1714354 RepID=A0A1Q5P2T7_9BACI|nr:ABC transporter permease subunit [Domibacillus mangrovi]OKL36508.1 multidrug ABC transporter permease [Domibacillus mangrovi]
MIYKREVSQAQKALWIWIIALGGMSFLIMSVYPQFAANKEQLENVMKLYPEAMLKAFNIDSLGFDTPLGFYAIEGYLFVTLFGSIYAAMMAGSMIVKEESEKTVEFLLSKPVSRGGVIAEKALAVFTNLFLFNAVLSLINYAGFRYAGDEAMNMKIFFMISLAPFLLHLTFAAIAFAISAIMRKSRAVTSISLAVVLLSYFFDIVQSIAEKFEPLKYVTPFEYVDSAYIIEHAAIKPLYASFMVSIIVIGVLIAYAVYKRKDLSV